MNKFVILIAVTIYTVDFFANTYCFLINVVTVCYELYYFSNK